VLIYLARPIDAAREDPKAAYQHMAEDLLGELAEQVPVAVYLPAPAFMINGRIDRNTCSRLVAINEHALEMCDILVAEHISGVSSYGVPQEIMQASMKGKFVLVLSKLTGYDDLPINLRAYVARGWVFREMDELLPVLVKILTGETRP